MKKNKTFIMILLLGVSLLFVQKGISEEKKYNLSSFVAEATSSLKKKINCNHPDAKKLGGEEQYNKVCIQGSTATATIEVVLSCDDTNAEEILGAADYKKYCIDPVSVSSSSVSSISLPPSRSISSTSTYEYISPTAECNSPNAKNIMGEIEYNRKCVEIDGCQDDYNENLCMGEPDDGYIYEAGEKGVSNNVYSCVTKPNKSGKNYEQDAFVENPYCSVFCKEDAETYYQGFGYNPQTGYRIGSGQYFGFKPYILGNKNLNDLPYINQSRTCIYKTDIGKLTLDLYGKAYNKNNINTLDAKKITGGLYKTAYDALITYHSAIDTIQKTTTEIFKILKETDCVTGKISSSIVDSNAIKNTVANNKESETNKLVENIIAEGNSAKNVGLNQSTFSNLNQSYKNIYAETSKGVVHNFGTPKGGFHIGTYDNDKESEICCKYSKWKLANDVDISRSIKIILIGLLINKPELMESANTETRYTLTVNVLSKDGKIISSNTHKSAPRNIGSTVQVVTAGGYSSYEKAAFSCNPSDPKNQSFNSGVITVNNMKSDVVCDLKTDLTVSTNSYTVNYAYRYEGENTDISKEKVTTTESKDLTQSASFTSAYPDVIKVECDPKAGYDNLSVSGTNINITKITRNLLCIVTVKKQADSGYSGKVTFYTFDGTKLTNPIYTGTIDSNKKITVKYNINGVTDANNSKYTLEFNRKICSGKFDSMNIGHTEIVFNGVESDVECRVPAFVVTNDDNQYKLRLTVNLLNAPTDVVVKSRYLEETSKKASGMKTAVMKFSASTFVDERGNNYLIDANSIKCNPQSALVAKKADGITASSMTGDVICTANANYQKYDYNLFNQVFQWRLKLYVHLDGSENKQVLKYEDWANKIGVISTARINFGGIIQYDTQGNGYQILPKTLTCDNGLWNIGTSYSMSNTELSFSYGPLVPVPDVYCHVTAGKLKVPDGAKIQTNSYLSNSYVAMGDESEGNNSQSQSSGNNSTTQVLVIEFVPQEIMDKVNEMTLEEMEELFKKELEIENLDILKEKIFTGDYWQYKKGNKHELETRICEDTKTAKSDNTYISNTVQYTDWKAITPVQKFNQKNEKCLDEDIDISYSFANSQKSRMDEKTAYVDGYKSGVLCERITYKRDKAPCSSPGSGSDPDPDPDFDPGTEVELCLNKLEEKLVTLTRIITEQIEIAEEKKVEYFTTVREIKNSINLYTSCLEFDNNYTSTDMPKVEGFAYDEMERTNPNFKKIVSKIKLEPKTEIAPTTSQIQYCAHSKEGMNCNDNETTTRTIPIFIEEIKTVTTNSSGSSYSNDHNTESVSITFYDNAYNAANSEVSYGVGTEIYSLKPNGDVTTKDTPEYMAVASNNAYNYLGYGLPVSIMTRAGKYNYSFDLVSLGKRNRLLPIFSEINGGTTYECNYFVGNEIICHTIKCIDNLIICPADDDQCYISIEKGSGEIKDSFYKPYARMIENSNINPADRELGSNWKTDKGLAAIEKITEDGDSIYLGAPEYSIVLSANLIKEFKNYNKTKSYAEFGLRCNADGNDCTSPFLDKYMNSEDLANSRSKWKVYNSESKKIEEQTKSLSIPVINGRSEED